MDEFRDTHEAATYTMLKQVLTNHCTTHAMTPLAALGGCSGLLAVVCVQLCRVGADPQTLVPHTLGWLQQRLHARRLHPPLPLFATPTQPDALHRDSGAYAEMLAEALGVLLHDVEETGRVAVDGGFRIVLSLTADLLSMFLHQYAYTLVEVEALLEAELGPALTVQIRRHQKYMVRARRRRVGSPAALQPSGGADTATAVTGPSPCGPTCIAGWNGVEHIICQPGERKGLMLWRRLALWISRNSRAGCWARRDS